MRQVVAGSLWLNAAALAAHSEECKVDQALGGDVDIVQLADVHLADGFKRGLLGFAQRPGLSHFQQVLVDHVFDGDALPAGPLDRTWLVQLRFALARPRLGSLFTGEGLALLVDLHSVAFDADLSRVAHSPIRQFSCPDSCHFESGTRQF